MRNSFKIVSIVLLVVLNNLISLTNAQQAFEPDTLRNKKYEQFYDSLKYKANRTKITKLIYDFLISPTRSDADEQAIAMDYYRQMEGKIISDIKINSLEVFGPTLDDTTRKAKGWLEKTANSIHTKSNLKTIEKMLLFKAGDFLDPELLYENERIIRSLPYIKDIRFILEQDTIYNGLVKVYVVTKDRFSLGVSGAINGGSSAAFEVYNQNIFGIGHEISVAFVGHLHEQPYTGLETFYNINNIKGKFIDISAGYMNTYQREGLSFILSKPFFTPSVNWGYGISVMRMYRTERISEDVPIQTEIPFNLSFYNLWGGKSLQIHPTNYNNSQIILALGLMNHSYIQRPGLEPEDYQYFANHTLYLASITFTQRSYVKDQQVYSYGITEDIPEGFKNELVYGYDINEFGNRHYIHLYLSNGNLLKRSASYLNVATGIGGYFKGKYSQQGQIQASLNFISRQITTGKKQSRLFISSNYLIGINRFTIENLYLKRDDYIRGFRSREASGKQRLSLDLEYVTFLNKQFYKFNMAVYGFADIGLIGSNKESIFTQDYYSGIGIGLRVHNENLVFQTLQLRLSFYPFSPDDVNFFGFLVDEQQKRNFYSYEPTAPQPLNFR